MPKESRWSHLQASAKQPGIGKLIDEAMLAIEKVNPSLKGVLPKDYARPALNAVMLGELIDLISGIAMGEGRDKSRDVLGRVYEYFLGQFAGSEGKRGRRVLHAAFRRAHHGRDAGAPQGPGIRPLLRIGRHVRAIRKVRRIA